MNCIMEGIFGVYRDCPFSVTPFYHGCDIRITYNFGFYIERIQKNGRKKN